MSTAASACVDPLVATTTATSASTAATVGTAAAPATAVTATAVAARAATSFLAIPRAIAATSATTTVFALAAIRYAAAAAAQSTTVTVSQTAVAANSAVAGAAKGARHVTFHSIRSGGHVTLTRTPAAAHHTPARGASAQSPECVVDAAAAKRVTTGSVMSTGELRLRTSRTRAPLVTESDATLAFARTRGYAMPARSLPVAAATHGCAPHVTDARPTLATPPARRAISASVADGKTDRQTFAKHSSPKQPKVRKRTLPVLVAPYS